jgi:hypothetical protein
MVTGYPSLSDPMTLFISTLNARSQQSGMLIWSLNSVGGVPFHGGWLCVSSPIRRTAVQSSDGSAVADCSGRYTFHFSPQYLASESLSAGTVVNCQFRGRDSGFAWPENVELTDAVRFTVLP